MPPPDSAPLAGPAHRRTRYPTPAPPVVLDTRGRGASPHPRSGHSPANAPDRGQAPTPRTTRPDRAPHRHPPTTGPTTAAITPPRGPWHAEPGERCPTDPTQDRPTTAASTTPAAPPSKPNPRQRSRAPHRTPRTKHPAASPSKPNQGSGLVDSRHAPHDTTTRAGAIAYWHVDDLDAAFARLLSLGAEVHDTPRVRGEGLVTASVIDPFGNILGIMFNQHYLDILASTQT
ncbi:VOC family protein [Actinokineospora iranica]|uniref:VOC family protein n=1 Tax=Actinokineospora iranica TaxID=1271860 RepID=UPI002B4B6740|nr:VOC family protein [Actinokineospora iranica]